MSFGQDDYRRAALAMIRPAGGAPGTPPAQAGGGANAEPVATLGQLLADAVRITLSMGWTPEVDAAWTQAADLLKAQVSGTSSPQGVNGPPPSMPPQGSAMGMGAAQGAPMMGRPPR